jgi:hypothetical protein
MGGHFKVEDQKLERDGGNNVEADESSESKSDRHGNEIHIDGEPGCCMRCRYLGLGWKLIGDGGHGETPDFRWKEKNPHIAVYADTWVPEFLRSNLFIRLWQGDSSAAATVAHTTEATGTGRDAHQSHGLRLERLAGYVK